MAEVDLEIFRIFRRGVHSENNTVKDLIDVKNSIFYLFDVSAGDILVTNSNSFSGLFDFAERYQVFEPRVRIFGEAKALRASENNVRVAVLTDLGLFVVHLPHIWTCLMMPPALLNYTSCEVWMVSPEVEKMPQVFAYEVLQARWHPYQHNYLLALYNDNYLRLLDSESHTLLRVLSLGRHPTSSISTLLPLHEHTVDFDFAPPEKKTGVKRNLEEVSVLLLTGTGDVSLATVAKEASSLNEPMLFKREKKSKHLMLTATIMHACSLIVLPCTPTVVVISSMTGSVCHCALVEEGNNKCLKVFEEYELQSGEPNQEHCVYLLLKDPGSTFRYFVLHAAGVHAVMLAVIPVLEHILSQEPDNVGEKLQAAMKSTESVVRHMVNTEVEGVKDTRPPFGVGVIVTQVTESKVLVLLADCQVTSHLVNSVFPPVTALVNKPAAHVKETRKQFSDVVGNYLLGGKSSRPPLLKVGEALRSVSPEGTLQFLRAYCTNLKEDRIKKHTVVAELIDAKARDVLIEYDCQRKQLEKLKAAREYLQQNAERIAEQYEETNEKHTELQKRLEMICLRISAPGRSVAEEKMKAELIQLNEKTQKLHIALQQAQALYEHRKSQYTRENSTLDNRNSQETEHRPLYLTEQRRRAIRQNLEAMSANIQEMKNRINHLNLKLSFIN